MLALLTSDLRPFIQDIVFFTLFACAVIWGGAPERAIAATWMILFEGVTRIYRGISGLGYQLEHVDLFHASIDGVVCLSWVTIALYANRNYPLLIAALQLLVVSAHLARGLIETVSPIGYAIMVIAPSWLQLIVLSIGLVRHAMRQRRFGPYRDWRRSPGSVGWDQKQSTWMAPW
ncbi:MAG: hypothetical protein AAFQ90_04320 [Pseudomonadota bacterium]